MRFLSILILMVALTLTVTLTGPSGHAEAQGQADKLTFFVIDRHEISSDQSKIDLVNSLLGLMFRLKEGQPFAFVFGDDFSNVYGPTDTNAEGFVQLRRAVEQKLASSPPSEPLDLESALAETYNYLNGLVVSSESSIFLITGDTSATDPGATVDELDPILDLIEEVGWQVFNVTTPEADPGLKNALAEIARRTSGESFELSIPLGLEELTNRTLIREGKGALQSIGSTTFSPDSVFETDLDIVPGTGELSMVFFREDDTTSFKLKNPSGVEATSADRESSETIELPNLAIVRLFEPVPGRWSLEVRGDSGLLTAHRYSINRYQIELQMQGAVPVGIPVNIIASVTDDGSLVSVDAGLLARITDPDGTSVLYDLNDEGTGGDAVAGDGYYSATLPSLTTDGTYNVEMQLQWPEIAHTITTLSSFDARLFPDFTLVQEDVEILEPGVRTKIAEITVGIGNQPYSVAPDDILPNVATNQGDPGALELVPRRVISEGKAFEYDVYYTAPTEALATVAVSLDVEYAGQQFMRTVDPIVISSIPPAQPVPTQPPAPTPAPAPTTAPPPPVERVEQSAPTTTILIVVGAIIAAAIAVLLINFLARVAPFGSILTEDGRLVVRLRDVQRAPLQNLLTRNRLSGDELGITGFESVSFRFYRDEVLIEPVEFSTNTVRLNNQPITDLTVVHDGSWLGAMGRLYTYSYSDVQDESQQVAAAGSRDDQGESDIAESDGDERT